MQNEICETAPELSLFFCGINDIVDQCAPLTYNLHLPIRYLYQQILCWFEPDNVDICIASITEICMEIAKTKIFTCSNHFQEIRFSSRRG